MGAFFFGWYKWDVGIPALIGWGESTRHPMASSYHNLQISSIQKLNLQI